MTVNCIILTVYNKGIPKGKKIQLDSVEYNGQIIYDYEWSINNVIINDRTSSIVIDTIDLQIGINTITHKIKNSCGSWSELQSKNINIIECTPNWQTGPWGECQPDSTQSRTVTDLNNCGVDTGKPATIQSCTYVPCTPNWQCESPLNGYEADGCGNRRLNSVCNPICILPTCSFEMST